MDAPTVQPFDLPPECCLICGVRLEKATEQDRGLYLPLPPIRFSSRPLGVRGVVCKPHVGILREDPGIEVSVRAGLLEVSLKSAIERENPEAYQLCVDIMAKSHPEVEDQAPGVKARLDRAELRLKGLNELHTWKQATWAWHVRAYGLDDGWNKPWQWIRADYVVPQVTRPVERRYVDMDRLPKRADGGPGHIPDPGAKGFEDWALRNGVYNWRVIEPARLVDA